jgi:hypothetical protein
MYDLSRELGFDTDHYMVGAKVRDRLAVNIQAAQKFNMGRFNLRKLSQLEVTNNIRLRSQTDVALKNLNDSEHINRGWENITENIKTSAKKKSCSI